MRLSSIRIVRIGVVFLGLVTWVLVFHVWSANVDPYVRRVESASVVRLYVFGSVIIVEGELNHFRKMRMNGMKRRRRIRANPSVWCSQRITC